SLAGSILEADEFKIKATDARVLAGAQGANLWMRVAALSEALAKEEPDKTWPGRGDEVDKTTLSLCADLVSLRLARLSDDAAAVVRDEARLRPERWRPALRRALDRGDGASQFAAAALLDEVGSIEDVPLLRRT